jgi:intermediate cleaving peptidase 55
MLAAALTSDRARPLEREVQRMRLVKSRRELGLMKDAADLSADGHAKVSSGLDEGLR